MTGRRGLTVLAALAGGAGWLLSGSSWPVNTQAGALTQLEPSPVLRLEPVPSVTMGRLTTAKRPAPVGERDPFQFLDSRPEGGRSAELRMDAGPPVATTEVGSPRPDMQLIGLAQDQVEGRTVRTAIITSLDQVYLVREGEQIALRFLVDRIGADAVQLRDLSDDSTITLSLR